MSAKSENRENISTKSKLENKEEIKPISEIEIEIEIETEINSDNKENKVLFVTTFNKDMYDKSAKGLIATFLEKTRMDLLVCYEGFNFVGHAKQDNIYNDERIMTYDISSDTFLKTWTKNNHMVIPTCFGGSASDRLPIFLEDKAKGQYWARYRAAGYFRKIVSLNHALEKYGKKYDIICVLDSDCIIKNDFCPTDVMKGFSNNAAMFFYWGKYRRKINRGPETGFTGYYKKNGGYDFAQIICKSFITQDFRRFEYWDDGYVIGQLINEHSNRFKFNDLVGKIRARTTRVMELPATLFFTFVHHYKNRHGKLYEHLELFQ